MQDTESVLGELWVSYKICLLKPRLVRISNVMDGYLMDVSSVGSATPLGNLGTLTAYNANSGFTEPSGVIANHIEIDPGYVGLIQVTMYYHFSAVAITAWTLPTITIHGNADDFTVGFLGSTDIQTAVLPTAPLVNKVGSVTSYFKVNGGYVQPGSTKTYIAVTNMTITTASPGPYFTYARIFINSLPSTFA